MRVSPSRFLSVPEPPSEETDTRPSDGEENAQGQSAPCARLELVAREDNLTERGRRGVLLALRTKGVNATHDLPGPMFIAAATFAGYNMCHVRELGKRIVLTGS